LKSEERIGDMIAGWAGCAKCAIDALAAGAYIFAARTATFGVIFWRDAG
jgi:hypothetical protein